VVVVAHPDGSYFCQVVFNESVFHELFAFPDFSKLRLEVLDIGQTVILTDFIHLLELSVKVGKLILHLCLDAELLQALRIEVRNLVLL